VFVKSTKPDADAALEASEDMLCEVLDHGGEEPDDDDRSSSDDDDVEVMQVS
jgi:hypothetical protein